MTIYGWLILAFWIVLVTIWMAFAFGAKRTAGSGRVWWRELALRVVILVVVLVVLRLIGVGHVARITRLHAINRNPVAGLIGVALSAIGVGFAIVARIHIGRNWGLPMSRKEDPALVTTGPYAVVRHPIYAGVLLAILGSAIGISIVWGAALVVLLPYFIYSARREEMLMIEQFPEQYAAYMKHTKMLVPYVF